MLRRQEMLAEALPRIERVQVRAPFGKVPLALRVFGMLPGWAEGVVASARG